LSTRETVWWETPASRATSLIPGRAPGYVLADTRGSPLLLEWDEPSGADRSCSGDQVRADLPSGRVGVRDAVDHHSGHGLVAVVDAAQVGGGVLVGPDVDPGRRAAQATEPPPQRTAVRAPGPPVDHHGSCRVVCRQAVQLS